MGWSGQEEMAFLVMTEQKEIVDYSSDFLLLTVGPCSCGPWPVFK